MKRGAPIFVAVVAASGFTLGCAWIAGVADDVTLRADAEAEVDAANDARGRGIGGLDASNTFDASDANVADAPRDVATDARRDGGVDGRADGALDAADARGD